VTHSGLRAGIGFRLAWSHEHRGVFLCGIGLITQN
jgi:hypothetical protein